MNFYNEIISFLIDAEFLSVIMFNKIIKKIGLILRNIFLPVINDLKNMDYSSGTLNYKGVKLLRLVTRFLMEVKFLITLCLEKLL